MSLDALDFAMTIEPNREPFAWSLALAAAALIGTLASACMMPFVAIGVASAATMSRPRAAVTISGIWGVNQILGFGLLGYPFTSHAIAWGIALGAAALGAMLLAAYLLRGRPIATLRLVAVFAAAFCAYEAGLFLFALFAGGTGTFTPSIVLRILANDGAWFVGVMALHRVLTRTAPSVFGASLPAGAR